MATGALLQQPGALCAGPQQALKGLSGPAGERGAAFRSLGSRPCKLRIVNSSRGRPVAASGASVSAFNDMLRPPAWALALVAQPKKEGGREGEQPWIQGGEEGEPAREAMEGRPVATTTGGQINKGGQKATASLFTALLVNYSLLISDWWQTKHTSKDRLSSSLASTSSAVASLPAIQMIGKVAIPVAASLLKVSSPYVGGMSKIDFRAGKILLQRFRGGRVEEERIQEELAQPPWTESGSKEEEVERVTPDGLDPNLLWGQRKKDVEAEDRRRPLSSPGFSYSAAGLLFPYHLGVTQCLMDYGFIKEDTPLAGSSAGAIVCAVVASGVGMKAAMDATKQLAKDCRENGTAFRLGLVLRKFLEEFLPEDVHIRASGRIRVAVTQVFRSPRGLLVDKFDSKEDLINCLITSSFVPGYLAPAPATWFRDRFCVDGGISLFMPPAASKETVRVCAFPASSFGLSGIGISPDVNPVNRASMRQLFNWALEPAEDEMLDVLFEDGYSDALRWVQQRTATEPLLLTTAA